MAFEALKSFIAKNIFGSIMAMEAFAQQRAFRAALRGIKDGEGIVRVTSNHPVEEIAAIGKIFDELKGHPIFEPFMRHKPKLIAVLPETELPVIGKITGALIYGNKVFMDTHTFDSLSHPEIKALLAHEMAHHVRLDQHARNSFWLPLKRAMPFIEVDADRIAVAVTKDAPALESALKKLSEIHPAIKESHAVLHEGSLWKKSNNRAANGFYLPEEERSKLILKIGEKVQDSERLSHLENEIKRRLASQHEKTFGNHK